MVTLANIDQVNINAANVAGTEINAANFTSVNQMWIRDGVATTEIDVVGAALATTYGISSARSYTYDINFRGSTGTSDTAQLAAVGAGTRNATTGVTGWATFDVESGASIEAISLLTGGVNHVRLTGSAETDVITLTGDGTNNIEVTAAAAALTLDASATTGTNTLRMGTLLSSTDTITGGSGRDTLVGTVTSGTMSPTVTDVEALSLTFTGASTFSAKNVDGSVDTITITPTANATLTNINESVTTLRVGATADLAAAGNISVAYASGSDSDVAFNIGATPTSSSTDTAEVSFGDLTLTNNAGALNVNSIGRGEEGAANVIASISADDVSSVTLTADTTALEITGAIDADSATEYTVDATVLDVNVGDVFTSSSLATFTVTSGEGDATVGSILGGNAALAVEAEEDESIDLTATITSGIGAVEIGDIGLDSQTGDGKNLAATLNITSGNGDVFMGDVGLLGTYGNKGDNKGSTTLDLTVIAADGDVLIGNVSIDDDADGNTKANSSVTVSLTAQNRAVAAIDGLTLESVNATDITIAAVDRNSVAGIGDPIFGGDTGLGGSGTIDSITVTGAGFVFIEDGGYDGDSDIDIDATENTGGFFMELADAEGALTVALGNARSGTQNTITTGVGNDYIVGGTGVDVLRGGVGDDTLLGAAGNDIFVVGGTGDDQEQVAGDVISGGTGTNVIQIAAEDTTAEFDFDNISDVLSITTLGTTQDATVIFSAIAETTVQTLTLNAATLTTGELVVTNNAASSTTTFNITGGGGADIINGSNGADTLSGGAGNDTINGGAGDDSITGGAGDDSLTGGAGADTILGGAGNDTITGGAGADSLTGGSGDDTFVNTLITDFAIGEEVLGGAGSNTIQFSQAGEITYVDRTVVSIQNLNLTAGSANDVTVYQGTGLTLVTGLGVNDAEFNILRFTTNFNAAAELIKDEVDAAGEWYFEQDLDGALSNNGAVTYFDEVLNAAVTLTFVDVTIEDLSLEATVASGNLNFVAVDAVDFMS